MQHTIDLDLLRSLVSFEEMGSLAKAANRVGRSESAVSLQLKRLDELFGQSLFVHSGRRLVLTENGYAVLHRARRILAMNDELASLIHERLCRVAFGSALPMISAKISCRPSFAKLSPDIRKSNSSYKLRAEFRALRIWNVATSTSP
jgi:DNA-binding transcriptional LysR family regulator